MNTELKDIIGGKVLEIYLNKEYLKFVTDKGNFVYRVDGDCCSNSFFYDFYGVKNLLENGPITDIQEVDLTDKVDAGGKILLDNGELKIYGYQIITHSEKYGDMTSVFSFRNESNGYYGGCIGSSELPIGEKMEKITKDVIEVK